MKKILVFYFAGVAFKELPWEHKTELDYSVDTRNQIIDTITEAGYNVMLIPNKGTETHYVIMIDDKTFRQR